MGVAVIPCVTGVVGQLEADIIRLYKDSFLDAKFENNWKVAKIQKINNQKLQKDYDGERLCGRTVA